MGGGALDRATFSSMILSSASAASRHPRPTGGAFVECPFFWQRSLSSALLDINKTKCKKQNKLWLWNRRETRTMYLGEAWFSDLWGAPRRPCFFYICVWNFTCYTTYNVLRKRVEREARAKMPGIYIVWLLCFAFPGPAGANAKDAPAHERTIPGVSSR